MTPGGKLSSFTINIKALWREIKINPNRHKSLIQSYKKNLDI